MPRVLRRLPLVLAFLAAFAPAALRAQAEVRPGTRVRILSAADTLIRGTVVTVDSASLLVAPRPGAEFVRVPLSGVQRLEVSRGGTPSTLTGAAIGTVLGAGVGLGAGLLATREDCEYVCGAAQVGTTVIGGAVGLVVGALFGSSTPRGPERWHTVPVPPVPAAP